MNADNPVVTVIVIGGADGPDHDARIARSTRSVQRQSMRRVELLVTDARLSPDDALRRAAGEHVLFLESGNVLTRHAVRSALAAALDSGADIVCGGWRPPPWPGAPDPRPVYRRTAHYSGAEDHPALLHDTTLGSKLFRTRLLTDHDVRFVGDGPAGVTGVVLAAYVVADGIAVIPQQLLVQLVEPARPDPYELLTAYADVDRLLARGGSAELTLAAAVRFLETDLPRCLLALADEDEQAADRLLAALRDHVDALPPEALTRVDRMTQIAAFMVRTGDIDGSRATADYLARGHRLSARLTGIDGRVYWSDRHLDDVTGRNVLDVTALGLHELPLSQLVPASSIERLDVRSGRAYVQGRTANPLGRLPVGSTALALRIGVAGADDWVSTPVRLLAHDADHLHWEGVLALASVVRACRRGDHECVLQLSITSGSATTTAPLDASSSGVANGAPLATPARWYLPGVDLRAASSPRGDLVLRLEPTGTLSAAAARLRDRLSDPDREEKAAGRPADAVVSTGSLKTKARVLRFVLSRLPQRRRSVVFESHMGLGYSDNPRYVSEELQRRNAGFDIVWSFAGPAPPVPSGVRTVRRTSWRHIAALARAQFWVDNQGLPQAIQKPDRVTYLQTWHGSALKRMGEDTPGFARLPPERQERHRRAVGRWDYFVARSEHDVRTLVPALHVRGEVLRTGYPRNDPLVRLHSVEERAAMRAALGLPADKTLVMYAPTFRETYGSGVQDFALPIDLDEFFDRMPDHRLLVRTHYLQRLKLPAATHAVVRDVSAEPDITPLLVAADVLITDYSSVMFDFANTGRPMLFYVYDYDDYAHSERGVYWELAEKAPGPMVASSAALIDALATLDSWRPDYDARYRSFVAEFGEYDTGAAARQVVDRVFFGSTGAD